jgi:hypothetical protein
MKCILMMLCVCALAAQAQTPWPEDLILTPEKSNFVKTSTHAEVMAFLKAIETKAVRFILLQWVRAWRERIYQWLYWPGQESLCC